MMTEEDKEWITGQFTSQVNGLKLEMMKDISEAIKALPCEGRLQESQQQALQIQRNSQRLDNGNQFTDKLDKIKTDRRTFNIGIWQLIVAGIAIVMASNIPWMEIVKLIGR